MKHQNLIKRMTLEEKAALLSEKMYDRPESMNIWIFHLYFWLMVPMEFGNRA